MATDDDVKNSLNLYVIQQQIFFEQNPRKAAITCGDVLLP